MNALVVSICLSAAVFALGLSVVSLVLHWTRRLESPEIEALESRIQEMKVQHLDLLDKVEHWRRRDNVRRARQGAEDKLAEDQPGVPNDPKAELRRRASARGLGVLRQAE